VMITRGHRQGARAVVAGHEVYGNDPRLRAGIAACGLGFVLAVAKDHRIPAGAGPPGGRPRRMPPSGAWQQMSPAMGKDPRLTTGP
jgi:hypothetical protein